MAEPRDLLNRGLEIVSGEMTQLEASAKERGLLTPERENLVAYMGLLRQLVGKDLGGEEDMKTFSEEELMGVLNEFKSRKED